MSLQEEVLPGSVLRQARTKASLTQAQLADMLGVNFKSLSNWETNQARVPARFNSRLAGKFPEVKEFFEKSPEEKEAIRKQNPKPVYARRSRKRLREESPKNPRSKPAAAVESPRVMSSTLLSLLLRFTQIPIKQRVVIAEAYAQLYKSVSSKDYELVVKLIDQCTEEGMDVPKILSLLNNACHVK